MIVYGQTSGLGVTAIDETSFFDASVQDVPVRVTNARFIVGTQTYAMNGVTSVKAGKKPKKIGVPVAIILLGVIFAFGGAMQWAPFAIGLGAIWIYFGKTTYTVVLSSSSGEVTALSGHNPNEVRGVVDALNDAIIHRG